ncbi:hypothetical protein L6654_29975 [Bradyrhizobium sp. WYCCWR 13023]|uniref:Uncharacterized protein n=1 Tax=Bradyrhizobium zhengyangense TaxID=2911009 RepID=A0A9X1RHT8_9BRAD|nr:hypothetical protein [Bradyrhizobium zhengyangense]MCG2630864.1 hypothetical protein [Bradyrhizobium zhengyangense]MCG2644483.1 hypothetical protein [Bradyrhizobium zhengyangense]MCG2672083.1 hypothetical protein [Bradyrhizobium zhengyangense]
MRSNHAPDRNSERRDHERHRGEAIKRGSDQLAAAEPETVRESEREEQKRRIEVVTWRMLPRNLAGDRAQPARKQVCVKHRRDQNRQRECTGCNSNQHQLARAPQRQEIERSEDRTVDQLERGHEAEQRSPGQLQRQGLVPLPFGTGRTQQQSQRHRGQQAAEDRKIAGRQNPFKPDEAAKHEDDP